MERLRARLGRLFAFRPPPPGRTALRASAAPFSSTVVVASMVGYSSTVSKLEAAADIPEEARQATHHVKDSNGKTIKFRNPHPSAGALPSVWEILSKMIW